MTSAANLYMKKGQSDVWITPRSVTLALGEFGLDPCAAVGQPFLHAAVNFTEDDDGLSQPWIGRVWMNPPYSSGRIQPFIDKFVAHSNGIALVFPRTDTKWFQKLAANSDAVFLHAGRLKFIKLGTGISGGFLGSVFVAYGKENVEALKTSGLPGVLLCRL